jgi:hypothetical protein
VNKQSPASLSILTHCQYQYPKSTQNSDIQYVQPVYAAHSSAVQSDFRRTTGFIASWQTLNLKPQGTLRISLTNNE